MITNAYNVLVDGTKDIFLFFDYGGDLVEVFDFSACSFNSSVSTFSLLIRKSTNCFLIFFFFESFCFCDVTGLLFFNYYQKNSHKTVNLKHPHKQKYYVWINFEIVLKRLFFYIVNVVKVLDHHYFCKTIF